MEGAKVVNDFSHSVNGRRGSKTLEPAPGKTTCVAQETVQDRLLVWQRFNLPDTREAQLITAGGVTRSLAVTRSE